MAHVARQLSDDDISAVSAWLSSQVVPVDSKAAPAMSPTVLASKNIRCGSGQPAVADASPLSRGAYLARIGNCAACHTARGGEPFAGGRGVETPFGTVYATNLTPDPVHGIGHWTADDFWQALHNGKSRDGRLLNPAFPYTSYTHITREDSDALWSHLLTVAPSSLANKPHALQWPLGTQLALRGWRFLYFTPGKAARSLAATPHGSIQRGEYLVKGMGHCAQCHAQRNVLGGIATTEQGGIMAGSPWYAPSLLGQADSLLTTWTALDIETFLLAGRNRHAHASGPMAEVVSQGTQHLNPADARAIAAFLKSSMTPVAKASNALVPQKGTPDSGGKGARLYENQCAQCHGKTGLGHPNAYPPLAGNRAVTQGNTNNLILKVLHGGFEPATAANPKPFGMPPFLLALTDTEVAAVLTYIRSAWGNSAAAVSEFDINRIRASSKP
jgi:mono/diheme cytochrome c family protein